MTPAQIFGPFVLLLLIALLAMSIVSVVYARWIEGDFVMLDSSSGTPFHMGIWKWCSESKISLLLDDDNCQGFGKLWDNAKINTDECFDEAKMRTVQASAIIATVFAFLALLTVAAGLAAWKKALHFVGACLALFSCVFWIIALSIFAALMNNDMSCKPTVGDFNIKKHSNFEWAFYLGVAACAVAFMASLFAVILGLIQKSKEKAPVNHEVYREDQYQYVNAPLYPTTPASTPTVIYQTATPSVYPQQQQTYLVNEIPQTQIGYAQPMESVYAQPMESVYVSQPQSQTLMLTAPQTSIISQPQTSFISQPQTIITQPQSSQIYSGQFEPMHAQSNQLPYLNY
eukprot:NODE_806_length_1325_cov_349.626959_g611_i0.p1 GENE.NODE_806_length_1325_cov_349.626959_g611_i0~~NODE_806_length_1325_cov_349.626959_g611_i0.p1  ORF type:complete len:343 (-),score=48.48 NODE_806_length_1325_cov_349.626959_g611_i0:244-1272(-)